MKRFLIFLVAVFLLEIAAGVDLSTEPADEGAEPVLVHEVKEKETAYSIARMYGMETDEIALLNNLDSDFKIVPGQRLAINPHSKKTVASWYGPGFHGRKMANGARFNMHDIIAAHKNLPIGTAVLIANPANGRTIVAPVLDRGPYIKGRDIDLSYGAAKALKTIDEGVAPVKMTVLAVPLM